MKHIFKKNQVIITALAIMIAVAGYLQFNQDKVAEYGQNTEESLDAASMDTEGYNEIVDLEEKAEDSLTDNDELADVSQEDMNTETMEVSDKGELVAPKEKKDNAGEAVLVNNTISADFFATAKLKREQTRAKNKETLMELVDDKNITEEQKKDAIKAVIELTAIAEKESATEILLEAKGFKDVVLSVVKNKADVIINAQHLTDQQIAQIEDIVKRKTEIEAKNIVISPVGVKAED